MRDLLLVATFVPMLPFAFLYPWIGILVWCWISYMNPHRLTFGFAYDAPFALVTAVVTLAGLLLSRDRKALPRTPEVFLMLLLWFWFTVTSVFAIHQALGWAQWQQVSKILIMTVVTMMLFRDANRLQWLFRIIALSIAYYGIKSGIGGILTGFQGGLAYPPASFIADNNDLALVLNMTLPLLWFLARSERRAWVRWGVRAAFVLTVIGILATYSRGGFLALCVVLTVVFARSRAKSAAVVLLTAAILFGSYILPSTFFRRMETIASYEQDQSAQNRLNAWTLATRVALDSPVFGGGFRVFEEDVWQRYDPEAATAVVAHSIYFQTLGEHGFVGLGLFIMLLAVTYRGVRKVRRRAALSQQRWMVDLALAVEASLAAYMVGGAFLSRAYFDLFYHLVAVTALLRTMVATKPVGALDTTTHEPAYFWGNPSRVRGT